MICRKCANIFDDSAVACPCCGWSTQQNTEDVVSKKAEPFKVNINFGNDIVPEVHTQPHAEKQPLYQPVHSYSADSYKAQHTSAVNTAVRVNPAGYDTAYRPETKPQRIAQPQKKVASSLGPERVKKLDGGNSARPVQISGNRVERVQYPAVKRPEPNVKKVNDANKESFSDANINIRKKAANIIVISVCVLALIMGGLTAIGAKTDVFSKKSESVKTTPMTGLSSEDSGSLEKQLTALGLSADFVFDSSNMTPNEFLALIRPYDNSGLYSKFYSQSTKITSEADPADRFSIEQENQGYYYSENTDNYAYYKISGEEIDSILAAFGMTPAHTANDEDYYYSKGNYYFAHKDEPGTGTDDIIDVTSSNRIDDGSYYVQCSRLNARSGSALKNSYLIVEKGDNEDMPWIIKKVSDEPVFGSDGKLNTGEGAISYTMKTTSVKATAEDGTVYCTYSVSYPEFGNSCAGEQIAGRISTDIMSAIKLSCENAQKDYEKFISYGGDKSALPFESETVCFVSYNKDGYIGVVRETADNLPDLDKMKKDSEEESSYTGYYSQAEEEKEALYLPSRYFEAYLIEKDTGDFVKKDSVIGKDYQTAYELVYRIYSGYDYKEVADSLKTTVQQTSGSDTYGTTSYTYGDTTSEYQSETTEAYAEVPEDKDELGKKIYESASTLCDDGYVFCFVTDEGYSHRVVIPFSVEELFVLDK